MKILLIDPRGWQGAVSGHRPFPNIGIAYLVPALRREGHQVFLVDLNNEKATDEEVLSSIRRIRSFPASASAVSIRPFSASHFCVNSSCAFRSETIFASSDTPFASLARSFWTCC